MSMAIRSPRQSALGVTWLEDFSRGRLGVAKNQGVINEAAPNVIGFDGKWARFPGNVAAYIQYPHLITKGKDSITVGCRIRNVVNTGAQQQLITQSNAAAWPANFEFFFAIRTTGVLAFGINIAGTYRFAYGIYGPLWDETRDISVSGTWASGNYVRTYINGVQDGISGATYAGTINDTAQSLRLGRPIDAAEPMRAELADPLIDTSRAWSAAEILAYHNRSMF